MVQGAPKGTMPPNAGKGRPKGSKNKLSKHRQALTSVMTFDRQQALWASMLKLAVGTENRKGDVAAARLIAEYMLGKAPQAVTLHGTVEHEHHAIPDDELQEIALRSAERIVRMHRLRMEGSSDNHAN